MESFIFGRSRQNLPIIAHRLTQGSSVTSGKKILILGGVHGDEPEGVVAAIGLLEMALTGTFRAPLPIVLVPWFNADGVLAKTRGNSAGVDLNRNLPTQDWTSEFENPRYNPGPQALSEPENQALLRFVEQEQPTFVLSLHSWHPVLNINGACTREAKAIAKKIGYEVSATIGYSTPGCLGTYCGLERQMPTLTYEIERGISPPLILRDHVPAIIAGVEAHASQT